MLETYDVTLTVEIRMWAHSPDEAAKLARAALAGLDSVEVEDTAHVTHAVENGYITETIPEDYSNELDERVTTVSTYDHEARPDDDNEPGDRCKDCGQAVVWIGPSHVDWLHVNDMRNQ